MNYNQSPNWHLNFRRALDRFTRMATVAALVCAAFKHFCAEITGRSQGSSVRFRAFRVGPVL
jgi:hypothetical protein